MEAPRTYEACPSEPGIRKCMRCGWLFVSPDLMHIRRCRDCSQGEEAYAPRSGSTDQIYGAIQSHLWGSS